MAGLRDIKRKIASVKSTRKITMAMKMVSAARMRRSQELLDASTPYASAIEGLVADISAKIVYSSHPFVLARDEVKSVCVVIVTSDRGLCGGFNSNVIKETSALISKHRDKKIKLITIGKRGYDFFKRRDNEIINKWISFNGRVRYEDSITIGEYLTSGYVNGDYDEVYLVYNRFRSTSTQVPVAKKVLPFVPSQDDEKSEITSDYSYEPASEQILEEIFPKYINFLLYNTMLESIAGEHGSRMVAMDAATNNASEFMKKLTVYYNKARQSAITSEILDIVNGAEALR